jgi:tetratricopeptide (TPR) repeat protein
MTYRKLAQACLVLLLVALVGSGCTVVSRLQARDQLNKGVNAYRLERYDEAIGHFQEAVRLDSQLSTAHLYLATSYRRQFIPGALSQENLQLAQNAIVIFEEVIEIEEDPKAANAINAMANIAGIYQGLNDYDQAKEWYRKRIAIEETTPDPLYGIGVINWQLSYDKTGMTGDNVENLTEEEKAQVNALVKEGIDSLQKALEVAPDYVEAMQYLNLVYREKAKMEEDPEQKKHWERQADELSLQALEVKKQQEEEAERARRTLTGATADE